MVYLVEKAKSFNRDRVPEFCPTDPGESYGSFQWVMWQTAHQAFPPRFERSDSVTARATWLYSKLNQQLDRGYIAGQHYSIADMMCYPWVANWLGQDQDVSEEYQRLRRWFREVGGREPVQRGMEQGYTTPDNNRALPEALARASVHLCRRGPIHLFCRGPDNTVGPPPSPAVTISNFGV
jgi:GSH-dependent disulfide-bond oxidoreductase